MFDIFIFQTYLLEVLKVVKVWWWFFLPIFLYFPTKKLYFWWINWNVWYKEQEWVILELIPPSKIEKSSQTMEDVYTALWAAVYDAPNWRGKWCEGEPEKYPYCFSIEIVSIEGKVHFYLRIPASARKGVESVFYSHYPDIEIFEAKDYTRSLPRDLPNQEYDLLGEDYVFLKSYVYPIKTYKAFEGEKIEGIEPEKRIDPIHSFLEDLVRIGPGEQVWFQIIATPIIEEIPWVKKAKEEINKIAYRPGAEKERSIVQEVFRVLFGPSQQKEAEAGVIPPEMKLTPGEREVLEAIESKISKPGFKVNIRNIYVARRSSFVPGHIAIGRSYFSHFATQNLNTIIFWLKTRTKVNYFFRQRRLYKRKKAIYEKYIRRLPPLFPKMDGDGNMVMNTEELATIFHFPSQASLLPPGVPRVLAKKGAPPPGIPTE